MGEAGLVLALKRRSPDLNFSFSVRFAWGLIPGVPAKSETGAEPTDIILRWGCYLRSYVEKVNLC